MKMRTSLLVFLIAILVTLLCVRSCSAIPLINSASENNGFDISNASIPVKEILSGGPAKDGIPAIDNPKFEPSSNVTWLKDEQQVLSLTLSGETQVYPLAIMNWHEIVNSSLNGVDVVISYCPLCGTGMGFKAEVNDKTLDFGVSGLLYNSDVLLYDRQTESLWSQLKQKAVSGPMEGGELTLLPLRQMTWKDWKAEFKEGKVLSRDTGHSRDYSRSPYGKYDQSPSLYFPVEFLSRAYHPKERVLGVEVDGKFKAYPFVELAKTGEKILRDQFNGVELELSFDAQSRTGSVEYIDSNSVNASVSGATKPAINAFWFAWYTFHPETEVYTASKQ
jgi:hypothetical protein